jgi:hypothetical protein
VVKPETIDGPIETLLLVEGPDDLKIIQSLLRFYRLENLIRIQDSEGYQTLRKEISSILDDSRIRYLGIVADSDTNLSNRWASVRDKLRECGCDPPKALPKEGAIFNGPRGVRVGVWLMPDNNMTGAMEAFLHQLISPDDPNWPYAQTCVANLPQKAKDSDTWRDKARLYTYLAWQEQPGKPPESVLRSPAYFDASAGVAQAFVAWVKLLFEIEERV